jgi:tight adherence protein B
MRSRRSLQAAAALVAAACCLLPASTAHAAASGPAISNLSVQNGTATLTVSVSLPAGDRLDPAHTTVTVGGVPVTSSVTNQSTTTSRPRVAALAVDTSGSMGPGGIAAARAAAEAYLARVAPDVKVGLISFADSPHVLTQPTTDRTAVRAALGQLQSKGETSLYDAVGLAVQMAGSGGAVVVLSDGADTVSAASLDATVSRVHDSGARVSTVAFRTADGVRGPLARIASAGSGQVVAAANASDLASAFASAAAGLPAQLQLRVDLPNGDTGGQALQVRLSSLHAQWSVATVLPASPGTSVGGSSSGSASVATGAVVAALPWYQSLPLALAAAFGALVLIAWLLLPRGTTPGQRRQELLDVYTMKGRRLAMQRTEAEEQPSAVLEVSQRLVDRGDLSARLTAQLEMAGSRLRPAEWVVVRVSVGLGIGAVAGLLTRNVLIGLASGVVLGWLTTRLWLSFRQSRRVRAFADALPDTLQLVASSLRTGFSLPQALDAAQQDGVEPMTSELGRALAAARIGVPLEDELDRVADRTRSVDWHWAVMAIRIQRSVGGNLAEVLTTTVRTLRERAATRRLVRSLSAEGRLSAYILIALPIMVFSFLMLIRRAYLRPLWTTTPGVVMIAGATLLMLVGALWMRQVVTVEE